MPSPVPTFPHLLPPLSLAIENVFPVSDWIDDAAVLSLNNQSPESNFSTSEMLSAVEEDLAVEGPQQKEILKIHYIFLSLYSAYALLLYLDLFVITYYTQVSSLLENLEDPSGLATSLIKQNGVYPLLLNCLIDG
ncbi:hypothetical protein LXL04_033509 [Taraxacum kok-saghyz]